MSEASVLTICLAAFVLIFILLSLLSIMMRVLTTLMPFAEKEDGATIAAITATYQSIYPDKAVTRIEETTK